MKTAGLIVKWKAMSKTKKGLIIGGAVVVLGAIVWFATKKKRA